MRFLLTLSALWVRRSTGVLCACVLMTFEITVCICSSNEVNFKNNDTTKKWRSGIEIRAYFPQRKNPLPLPGIEPRSPGRPARSQTLYCLS
jgi:hypothetical protein